MVEYAKQPTREQVAFLIILLIIVINRNFFGTLVYEKKYRVCSL